MSKKPNKTVWVRGGKRTSNPEDKYYFGHDDRVGRTSDGTFGNRRRVSFKPQGRSSRDISRSLTLTLDNDIPMAGTSNNNNRQVIVWRRSRGLSRGRNSPLPHRALRSGILSMSQSLPAGETSWYKITIPFGAKYTKDYILSSLNSIASEAFVPIMYKTSGNEASFYVDSQKAANVLLHCDRKITTTNGFKLRVKIKLGLPQCEISDALKERLKQAMIKRYVPETNALDLSKFHHDPDLIADYFCALSRPIMLMAVLDIVSEYVPTLEALNLDGNKLHMIEKLDVLYKKFPRLKILYIGDNKIKEMGQLDAIKELQLEELRLAGNPVSNRYMSRQSDYISGVRKIFPKLLRLDGMELPRPILFDVANDTTKMPPTQRLFVTDSKAQDIASQFLQQYFIIFDSENRHLLLDAYDEHARFSLTVINNPQNTDKLSAYLSENRNLFRIINNNKRQKLLKQGKLPVLSFIIGLPRIKHHLNTFTMDVSIEGMMLITVTGLFDELNNKGDQLRYFNRTFIIIPKGSGYCICNEQLHISLPTEEQRKKLITDNFSVQMTDIPSGSKTLSEIQSPQLTEDVKQKMALTLSQETNMNSEWSLKCLQEVHWNYENAILAFQELFKHGRIPSEAFVK
ncbi:nuclear RNA export factor 1-like isoform X2 [Vespa mandarinia]|uniref:nuclear RNA export factor 1-like isoform X2 n=1 Tax=Vespa mandarinia TaxID=7446 RepID=UPI00161EEA59|nr:nuclear RNA export factor 1-like isoform X2 [Vespa mandarinia]